MAIASDAVVDGVLRKAISSSARTVHSQKNRIIFIDKFLYKVGEDIIDTDVIVAPISGLAACQRERLETVGTIELRLSITQQLGVHYPLGNVEKYYNTRDVLEKSNPQTGSYKLIPPSFQMMFDKNSTPIDSMRISREQRKMASLRPGAEPWAIFRFHYRSKGKYQIPLFEVSDNFMQRPLTVKI